MRLRNEGEFLAQSIESWLPLLDELVIVYNNCQDNTAEIAEQYAKLYPNKIKTFHYLPIVYPQGSDNYKNLEPNNPHSLVNYYNFSLSQTTKKWAIKIDGDLILCAEKIPLLKQTYLDLKENYPNDVLPVSGINIIDHCGELYISYSSPYCGLYGDLCLFRVDEDSIFKKNKETEFLDISQRNMRKNIFAYYHLKFMKADFGIGNYELQQNKHSVYLPKTISFLFNLELIPLHKILSYTQMPNTTLSDFKLNRRRQYKLEAMQYLEQSCQLFSLDLLEKELNNSQLLVKHQKREQLFYRRTYNRLKYFLRKLIKS
ncbi:hypothetical protein [Histophilus somni]|uniref:hypothetical protein n=1 Tax=Histophilus somni TaxID=731 RepID=UPI0018ED7993|nr:hypothetical protein [Histophilus somni]QQF71818.1 hypothetical protein JFL50_07440 [Histophilus somni]QQF80121.1 hypothetical protein JFL51_06940 [Histophilus somni]